VLHNVIGYWHDIANRFTRLAYYKLHNFEWKWNYFVDKDFNEFFGAILAVLCCAHQGFDAIDVAKNC